MVSFLFKPHKNLDQPFRYHRKVHRLSKLVWQELQLLFLSMALELLMVLKLGHKVVVVAVVIVCKSYI